jgi:ABC-type bacteriocin/lantibiotic exporter with double-glycine peptidase domain
MPTFDPKGEQIELRHYEQREVWARMAPLLRPYWRRVLLCATPVALVGVFMSAIPLFTKYLVDVAIPQRSAATRSTSSGDLPMGADAGPAHSRGQAGTAG